MAKAEIVEDGGPLQSLHVLTVDQLSFALLFSPSPAHSCAALASIPSRIQNLVATQLSIVKTEFTAKTATMTVEQIEDYFESPPNPSGSPEGTEYQIKMFASLPPRLRAFLASRGKVQQCDWWKPLVERYLDSDKALSLQQLPNLRGSARLQSMTAQLELLRTKKAQLDSLRARQLQELSETPAPPEGPLPPPTSSLELLNMVPHIQRKAEQAEEAVSKVQATVVVLEKELGSLLEELDGIQMENAELRQKHKKGIPLVATKKVDVNSLAMGLKGAIAMRDELHKAVSQMEAKRDVIHQNCVAVADQISEVQVALEAAAAPDSHTSMLEERARQIEDLSAQLEDAESLLAAHRNRRVVAARELSVKGGVAAAMSLVPEEHQSTQPARWSRKQHFEDRSMSSTAQTTTSSRALHSHVSQPKDELFVRGMMKRLNQTTGIGQMTREQLDDAQGDPHLAMLQFWTGA